MQVEVLTGVERRRRWPYEEKVRLVGETLSPGVMVSEVARRHGVAQSLLFTWRRQAREGRLGGPEAVPHLVPVRIAATEAASPPVHPVSTPPAPARPRRPAGLIEIELGDGRRVRVGRDVDGEALRRVLDVLEHRPVRRSAECEGG
jgi:transposase